jgi:hypothetical protein
MYSCENLIKVLLPFFTILQFCIVKEYPNYFDVLPIITKTSRCTSTALLILRLLIGKKIYKINSEMTPLYITRQSLNFESKNMSLLYLDQLKQDIFKIETHGIFYVKIVKHYKNYIDNPSTNLDSHSFLIEKTKHKKNKFLLYQSYLDDYDLEQYLNKFNNSYTKKRMIDMIEHLYYIFSRKKWDDNCSKIWKHYFCHTLSPNVVNNKISNELFLVYHYFPIEKNPLENVLEFVQHQKTKIKNKNKNDLYDLSLLYEEPMITNKKLMTCLNKIESIL